MTCPGSLRIVCYNVLNIRHKTIITETCEHVNTSNLSVTTSMYALLTTTSELGNARNTTFQPQYVWNSIPISKTAADDKISGISRQYGRFYIGFGRLKKERDNLRIKVQYLLFMQFYRLSHSIEFGADGIFCDTIYEIHKYAK